MPLHPSRHTCHRDRSSLCLAARGRHRVVTSCLIPFLKSSMLLSSMIVFFCPNLEHFCPLFVQIAQTGLILPRWGLILPRIPPPTFSWPDFESGQNELLSGQKWTPSGQNVLKMGKTFLEVGKKEIYLHPDVESPRTCGFPQQNPHSQRLTYYTLLPPPGSAD